MLVEIVKIHGVRVMQLSYKIIGSKIEVLGIKVNFRAAAMSEYPLVDFSQNTFLPNYIERILHGKQRYEQQAAIQI
ncbi:MAG: hypothetical protein PF503_21575 [Desulfobacula sp.]|nr:hypothetical protein [Desulfobacula sp.]